MTDTPPRASTRTSRVINASRKAIYEACTDPEALAVWRAPGDMTAQMHEFDLQVGGGYRMSLYYPASERETTGKTADREDRFTSRYVELNAPSKIVEAIAFDSDDPAFSGELIMTVTLRDTGGQTDVTIEFENLPPGVRPEDNDAGTRSSLEKLAHYLEEA